MPRVPVDSDTYPLFPPQSDWQPPKEPPNILDAPVLGFDTETKDPLLDNKGPGFFRGDAKVRGISLAVPDGLGAWYFPISHPERNCEWDVVSYLKDLFSREHQYIGANLSYDVEALSSLGIEVVGQWTDIQIAEPLLDEEREGGYSLDVLAKSYLGQEKDETILRDAAAAFKIDPKKELWKLPAQFVGPYAEQDAKLPLLIWEHQKKRLEEENLIEVFNMESDLLPLVFAMRRRGVRVDIERAEILRKEWVAREKSLMAQIEAASGGRLDIWSPTMLVQICAQLGVTHPTTDKGNPSFSNEWMGEHEHPLLNLIAQARKANKMRRDFIEGTVFGHHVNGRIHASFHTMRNDKEGTRSGRFSSTDPNMQQIPARDPEYGPALRGLFLPEEGEVWFSGDFKSQEPRLTVHFAHRIRSYMSDKAKRMIEDLVLQYQENPMLDLHQLTADLCSTSKRKAKTINLGMTYGMGKGKLQRELGVGDMEAYDLFQRYHEMMPFVKETSDLAMSVAGRQGFVRTVLGRRRRFNKRGPDGRRMFTHKALNAVIQGSGADMMKMAMLRVHKEMGLIPLLTVHDEAAYSLDSEQAAQAIAEHMEQALLLDVPNKIDVGVGPNWAHAHG